MNTEQKPAVDTLVKAALVLGGGFALGFIAGHRAGGLVTSYKAGWYDALDSFAEWSGGNMTDLVVGFMDDVRWWA